MNSKHIQRIVASCRRLIRKQTVGLVVLASVAMVTSAQAATWYVDDISANGNGSSTSPWNSVSFATSQVQTVGDTIYVKAGSYTESVQLKLAVGVNLEGAGNTQTIITTTVSSGSAISASSTSGFPSTGQTLKNFKLITNNMTTPKGIGVFGRHNVKCLGLWVEGFRSSGITAVSMATSLEPTTYLTGIEVGNSTFKDCSTSGSTSYSGMLQISGLNGALIHNNTLSGLRADHGYGIKFDGQGWLQNCKLYNNNINLTTTTVTGGWGAPFSIEIASGWGDTQIYNNTMNGSISLIRETGRAGLQYRVFGNKLLFPGTNDREGIEGTVSRMEIYNNYFENVNKRSAIRVDWGADDINIHHNVFRNCGDAAVDINARGRATDNIKVYNNTFDGCANAIMFNSDADKGTGTVSNVMVKNNILMNSPVGIRVKNTTANLILNNVAVDYNNFHNNTSNLAVVSGSASPTWGTNNSGVAPSLKLTGGTPFPYYEHTSSSGNMVDQGNATDLDWTYAGFVGAAPDMGAHELAGSSNGSLPSDWSAQDIGNVGLTGSSSYANGVFTVKGAGDNIGGSTGDSMQFAYRTLTGDGSIIARISSTSMTGNSKVGVVMRENLTAGSKQVMSLMDFGYGTAPGTARRASRSTTNGSTSWSNGATGISMPRWFKVTRVGNVFTAYESSNGTTWTVVGTSTTVTMASSIKVGLGVCSRNLTTLNTVTFDNVSVVP